MNEHKFDRSEDFFIVTELTETLQTLIEEVAIPGYPEEDYTRNREMMEHLKAVINYYTPNYVGNK